MAGAWHLRRATVLPDDDGPRDLWIADGVIVDGPVTGATTLSLRLSTGWGMRTQRDQTVTLRLSGKDESVLVGEFEVE